MTDNERELLIALASMCEQYLGSGRMDGLDDWSMSAGESALELLEKYGLVDKSGEGRGGVWTEAGRALLSTA